MESQQETKQEETKVPSIEELSEQKDKFIKIELLEFTTLLNAIQHKMTKMSLRGIKRALFAAMSFRVVPNAEKDFNFQKTNEAELAGILARAFDKRFNIQVLNSDKTNKEGEEKNG